MRVSSPQTRQNRICLYKTFLTALYGIYCSNVLLVLIDKNQSKMKRMIICSLRTARLSGACERIVRFSPRKGEFIGVVSLVTPFENHMYATADIDTVCAVFNGQTDPPGLLNIKVTAINSICTRLL